MRTLEMLPALNMHGVISGRYALESTPLAIEHSGEGRGVKMVVKPNDIPRDCVDGQ